MSTQESMGDAPAVAAFILEALADLIDAHPRSWRIEIGNSYIEPRGDSVFVHKVLTAKNFSLADPACGQQIKDYLLEHEDYVLIETPADDGREWVGAIDRAELDKIIKDYQALGPNEENRPISDEKFAMPVWKSTIGKIMNKLEWCPFNLNAEWFLDDHDKGVWDDFLKEYTDDD